MTIEEYEQLKKEITRQMGAIIFDEVLQKDDWSKVDPELKDKYKKYVVSCITKTMNNMRGQKNRQ